MKTVQIDGKDMVVAHVRGNGDGGMKVTYLVDMKDGTYADKTVWWSDPVAADFGGLIFMVGVSWGPALGGPRGVFGLALQGPFGGPIG